MFWVHSLHGPQERLDPVSRKMQRDGATINRVFSAKDLEVWLDDDLLFKKHINFVVNKASKALGLISRMASEIRDPTYLKAFYCCWVRPTLNYAYIVWTASCTTAMQSLENIQRQFLRRFLHGYNINMRQYSMRCLL